MLALSAFTNLSDPYRAGVALGETLARVRPEVVFLFCSINYGGSADLVEGLNDALDNPELIVKVIDGCGYNNRAWVYYSAGTNVHAACLAKAGQTGAD